MIAKLMSLLQAASAAGDVHAGAQPPSPMDFASIFSARLDRTREALVRSSDSLNVRLALVGGRCGSCSDQQHHKDLSHQVLSAGPDAPDVIVTTYEMVKSMGSITRNLYWRLLVLDEGHLIKNDASGRHHVLKKVRAPARALRRRQSRRSWTPDRGWGGLCVFSGAGL